MTDINKRRGTYVRIRRLESGLFTFAEHAANGRVKSAHDTTSNKVQNLFEPVAALYPDIPMIYGYRVLDVDAQDRRKKVVAFSRYRNQLFRVVINFWYAKEGPGFTAQSSVYREVDKGRVWASKAFRDPISLDACIAKLVRHNMSEGGERPPQQKVVRRETRTEALTEEWTL